LAEKEIMELEKAVMSFIGRGEYFEVEKDLRNLVIIAYSILFLSVLSLIYSLIFKPEVGCVFGGILLTLLFGFLLVTFSRSSASYLTELKYEDEMEKEIFWSLDKRRTRILLLTSLALGCCLLVISILLDFILKSSTVFTYVNIIFFLVLMLILILGNLKI